MDDFRCMCHNTFHANRDISDKTGNLNNTSVHAEEV